MMLKRVEIRDFALIEHASLYPGSGLTVISGETGAGKSILIDAIGALIGNRASKDLVRTGSQKAFLEAVFELSSPAAKIDDFENDLKDDPKDDLIEDHEEIFLERTIFSEGRSECRIDGHLVKLSSLKEQGELLVSIHGQMDNQLIFQEKKHLDLLDAFGRESLQELLSSYEELRKSWQVCQREILSLGSDPEERNRRLEILNYQLEEILAADIRENEEEDLRQRSKILSAGDKIRQDLEAVYQIIGQDDDKAVGSLLQKAIEILDFSSQYSQKISTSRNNLLQLAANLDEIKTEVEAFSRRLDIDPDELALVKERLDLINELKRKYGSDEKEILSFAARAKEEIDHLQQSEQRFAGKVKEAKELEAKLLELSARIHAERVKVAQKLDAKIKKELFDLDMPSVRFQSMIEKKAGLAEKSWPAKGRDDVFFLISPNPGEPLKPLAQIASSGEASRVLLAIKTVLAAVDNIPVLIFDEIDSGISGKTTGSVGIKLKEIAKACQVLCVTHSAQIAARADRHYLIRKEVAEGRTSTKLLLLEEEERIDEIARLLSGQPDDPASRKLAEQLIKEEGEMRI